MMGGGPRRVRRVRRVPRCGHLHAWSTEAWPEALAGETAVLKAMPAPIAGPGRA